MPETNRTHYWYVLLILLLASWLRFSQLDLMEFKRDEAWATSHVVAVFSEFKLPNRGLMSSVGVYNPPIFIYLISLPGLLSLEPIFITQFIVLLNVATVFLCYWFGRRMFNTRVGLISSLLFATCPWAIIYSRKIWAQDCLPFFSIIALGGLYEVCTKNNRKWFVPATVAVGLLPGIHFSGILACIAFILIILGYRPRIGWQPWLVAIGILGIVYFPYLSTLQGKGNIGKTFSFSKISFESCFFILYTIAHFHFEYLLGDSSSIFIKFLSSPLSIFIDLSGSILILHFIGGFMGLTTWVFNQIKLLRIKGEILFQEAPEKMLCWLWVMGPLTAYPILSLDKPIHPHYLVILYPVQFWIVAYALDWLLGFVNRRNLSQQKNFQVPAGKNLKFRHWVTSLVLLLALAETIFITNFYHFLDTKGGTLGDYGSIYRYKENIAKYIVASSKAPDVWPKIVSPAGRDLWDYSYLVMLRSPDKIINKSSPEAVIRKFLILEDKDTFRNNFNKPDAEDIFEDKNFGPIRVIRLKDSSVIRKG